jgi:hypothetical protein
VVVSKGAPGTLRFALERSQKLRRSLELQNIVLKALGRPGGTLSDQNGRCKF